MNRYLTTLFLLLFLSGTAVAQYTSTLYRGRMPENYPQRHNGTCFWDRKNFVRGDVMYNGKLYEGVLMNVDAHAQELEVRPEEDRAPLVVDRGQVAWLTLGEKRLVNLRYLGYTEAPEGFFEVIRDGGKPLLMQVRKIFRTSMSYHNGQPIGYYDDEYDPDAVNLFERREYYYSIVDGQVVKIRKRALKKALKREDLSEPLLSGLLDTWHSTPIGQPQVDVPVAPGTGTGLPDGYFSEQQKDTTVVNYAQNTIQATYRNKVYVIGSEDRKEGKARVAGIVNEAETGEPLPGVLVFDDVTGTYVRSDAQGRYSILLPRGDNTLHFSLDSKEELALRVIIESPGNLDVTMTEKVTLLKAAVVSATSMENHRTAEMGIETVSMKTISKIPSAFGEGDILKAVLTLPGVQTVGEASGGFNVRGGSADQNLILFNENTIYNPSHLFGIFSAFNPDVVDGVELFKSSIPARYGGRISSVMTVRTKEGDMQRFKGSAGIGLLTSRLHLEGPISKGRTSFILGGRVSYSDWMLKMLPEGSHYSGGKAGFMDVNAGIFHRFGNGNTLQLSSYYAQDRFSFSNDTTFRYRNLDVSAVLRHRGDGESWQVSAGYDQFGNRLGQYNWEYGAYELDTRIRQGFLKGNRTRTWENHSIGYGADILLYALDPGILSPASEKSGVHLSQLDREWALEPSLYVSDEYRISDTWSAEGGLRLTAFTFLKGLRVYPRPEIRLSGKYSPADNLSFKAGFNTLNQYIHLITNTSAISPMDTWKLSDADIAPTSGWQAATGAYWTELNTGIDFSLEAYWKRSSHTLDYKPGAVLSMNPRLAEDLVPVYGRSYGVEAMVKKSTGKLTGWISYTYSRALLREMTDRGAQTIAGGKWYNAPYDKPHVVKLACNYALTHRYSFSFNVDYSTGRPVTIPIGQYWYGGVYRMAYSGRNTHRIPDYFRLDVALNIDPGHYLKALTHSSLTLGVYNLTGRRNPYSVYFTTNASGMIKGHMLSVFAAPIPYINLNILF